MNYMKYKVLDEDEYFEALEEGMEKGEAKKADEMLRSFKAQGFPMDAIAQASGMPLEYVQALV